MDSKDWKKFKRSGGYRRKVKKVYENMVVSITPTTSTPMMLQNYQADTNESASGSAEDYFIERILMIVFFYWDNLLTIN